MNEKPNHALPRVVGALVSYVAIFALVACIVSLVAIVLIRAWQAAL